jgi:hypothetical protein
MGWFSQAQQQHELLRLQPNHGAAVVALNSPANYLGSAIGSALWWDCDASRIVTFPTSVCCRLSSINDTTGTMGDCVKQKKAWESEKKHEKSNAIKTISKFDKNIR